MTRLTRRTILAAAPGALAAAALPARAAKQIWTGCYRYRDQDRQHQPL